MLFNLSKKQNEIRDEIINFIFEGTDKVLRVNSGAGSGKTTILKSVYEYYKEISSSIDIFAEEEAIPELKFTATTQPAVVQLTSIGCENTTTIHSFLNLTVGKDFKKGGTFLYQRIPPLIPKGTVCIIDEASFIDVTIKKYMDATSVRWILIGDDQQFLAINNQSGDVVPFGSLKELNNEESFRFKDKELALYVKTLKANVKHKRIEQIPDQVGDSLFCISDEQFVTTLQDAYTQSPEDCLVITFTNKNVVYYESNIRELLDQPDHVCNGDKLVFKSALRHKMGYSIDPNGGKTSTEVKVEVTDNNGLTLAGRLLASEGISFQVVSSKHKSGDIAYIVKDHSDTNKLIAKLRRKKSWNEFYAVKDNVAVANYGYASTAHGSQGLTVPYTFIDLTDVGTMAKIVGMDTVARMVYVAISRASKSVFIRGKLPDWVLGSYV